MYCFNFTNTIFLFLKTPLYILWINTSTLFIYLFIDWLIVVLGLNPRDWYLHGQRAMAEPYPNTLSKF